jgi:hypothetical protein
MGGLWVVLLYLGLLDDLLDLVVKFHLVVNGQLCEGLHCEVVVVGGFGLLYRLLLSR